MSILKKIEEIGSQWVISRYKVVGLPVVAKLRQTGIAIVSVTVGFLMAFFISSIFYLVIVDWLPNDALLMQSLLLAVVMLFPSLVFGRSILRLMPVQKKQQNNYIFSSLLIIVLTLTVLYIFVGVGQLGRSINDEASPYSMIECSVFILVQFVVMRKWYRFNRGKITNRHVVFLRRFCGFAEREVFSTLLRSVSSDSTVVVLTDPSHPSTTLDPFLVGFAGMKWAQPIQSMPLYIESDRDNWERSVVQLVQSAALVVVDIAENSEAMMTEWQIIKNADAQNRTIVLTPVGKDVNNTNAALDELGIAAQNDNVIQYSKELTSSIMRYILGFAAIITTLFFLVATGYHLEATWVIEFKNIILDNSLIFICAGVYVGLVINHQFFGKPNLSLFSSRLISKAIKKMLSTDSPSVIEPPTSVPNKYPLQSQSVSPVGLNIFKKYYAGKAYWRAREIERLKRSLLFFGFAFVWYGLLVAKEKKGNGIDANILSYIQSMQDTAIVILLCMFGMILMNVIAVIKASIKSNERDRVKQERFEREAVKQMICFDKGDAFNQKTRTNALCNRFFGLFFDKKNGASAFGVVAIVPIFIFILFDANFSVALYSIALLLAIFWFFVLPIFAIMFSASVQYQLVKHKVSCTELILVTEELLNKPEHAEFLERIYPVLLSKHLVRLEGGVFEHKLYRLWRFGRAFIIRLLYGKVETTQYSVAWICQELLNISRYLTAFKFVFALSYLALFYLSLYHEFSFNVDILLVVWLFCGILSYFYLIKRKWTVQRKIIQSEINFTEYQEVIECLAMLKKRKKKLVEETRQWVYDSILNGPFLVK